VERTLLSVAFDLDLDFDVGKIRIRVCLQAYRQAHPTMEERRFSAA